MSTAYKQDDGSFTSTGAIYAGGFAKGDTGSMVKAIAVAWLAQTRAIPVQFAIGTALHETNYKVNERDVEPNGHTTGGIFQLDVPTLSPMVIGDAIAAGMPEKDIYDLDDACAVFSSRCSYYLSKIIAATNDYNAANGLEPLDESNSPASLPPDIWAYVAIAHNQGLGSKSSGKACLGTIGRYGLDWLRYKSGNPTVTISMDRGLGPNHTYGDDVISGGTDWSDDLAVPTDATGVEIPPPTVDSYTSSKWRLVALVTLVALVALLIWSKPRGVSLLKGLE